jgi:FkbM family methyltransferase
LLADLLWEMTVQEDYESGDVHIRRGDIVVDGGAHVGVFTQYALLHGAGRVIAVEPDPTNIACLEANFARQIADGRVVLIKAGLWERETRLTLTEPSEANSGTATFLAAAGNGTKIADLPVLTLDAIVAQLGLSRVDFIKMDIEGSERFALRGAGGTLRRFKPRMAICTYHLPDDPVVVPATASGFVPDYTVHAKDIEFYEGRITPKVLFFCVPPPASSQQQGH